MHLQQQGQQLEHVGHELLHVLLQDLLEDGEQHRLEVLHGLGLGLAHDADGQPERLEQVVVVVRTRRVLGRLLQLLSQAGQERGQKRYHGLLESREASHDALHHVLVLGRVGQVEGAEEAVQQRLGRRGQVGGRDQWLGRVGRVAHDQDLVDGGGGVGVGDVALGAQLVDEEGHAGLDQVGRQLRPERHDVLDGVGLEHGQLVGVGRAQVGQDVFDAEVVEVDQLVGLGDAVLGRLGLGG